IRPFHMSEAFIKALNHIADQRRKGVLDAVIQDKMPEFRDGAFTVNRYIPANPPLLGMTGKNVQLNISRDTLMLVEKFGKRRGLTMEVSGEDIFLLNKNGERVAWLKTTSFAAASAKLFEEIGRALYNISPNLQSQLELMDGWQAAIARLLADTGLLVRLIVALFFIFSPALWVAISLFLTESIFFPRWPLILAGVVSLAAAFYLIRIYLRENFPELGRREDTSILVQTVADGNEKGRK
ncbi:MAG: hypothetical protein QXX57_05775, partial [Nitrososphaerota archaeon]